MQLSIESKMEIFARVYAKNMDVSIKMGPRFATDGKIIYVPPILDQTDPWIRFETEVCTYHETGHVKTNDFPTFKKIKDKAKRSIFNAVRDVCVEKTMQEEYHGLIKKWNEFLTKYVMTQTNENLLNPAISPFTKLLWIVYLRAREKQNGVNYGLIVPQDLEEIYQKRLAKFEDELAFNNNRIKDSLKITEEIWEALKEEAKKQEPDQGKPKKSKSKKDSKPEDSDSKPENSDDKEPEDSDDKEPEDSDSKSEDSDDKEPEDSDDKEPEDSDDKEPEDSDGEPEDEPLSDEAEGALKDIQKDIEQGKEAESINEDIQKDVNQYVNNTQLYREVVGLTETVIPIQQTSGWQYEVDNYEQEGKKLTGFSSSKMKILFLSEKASVMHRHLTHGRLDTRNLWKIDHSNELFKKRTPAIYEDSAVFIVCDHSGSMKQGRKNFISQSILTSLGNDMDKMNIPFAACGFTYNGSNDLLLNNEGIRTDPVIIHKIKDFEEPYRTVKHRFTWPLNCNLTAELPAIKFAAERLAFRKESKKVLFVLSDGRTETNNLNLDSAMRQATKEYIARLKQAGFKVVLIGILDYSIQDYDPEAIIITDLNSFASTFYSKLMKLIL